MKKLIIALVILLPMFSIAQIEGDNQIIVTTETTGNILQNVVSTLSMNGIVLTFTDGAVGYAITGPIQSRKGSIIIYMQTKDDKIIMNAHLYITGSFMGKVSFEGASRSALMEAWGEFDYVAKLLGTCEYRKVGKE